MVTVTANTGLVQAQGRQIPAWGVVVVEDGHGFPPVAEEPERGESVFIDGMNPGGLTTCQRSPLSPPPAQD